jgi:hypothetical protein
VALTALHFVTAIVVITGFATTLQTCRYLDEAPAPKTSLSDDVGVG